MESTAAWLRDAGLEALIERFEAEGLTPDLFGDLDDANLRELGLNMGERLRFARQLECTGTGAGVEPSATAVPSSQSEPEQPEAVETAQWRQLTVLFVDLVGSTQISLDLGAEHYRELVLRYQTLVSQSIETFDGFLTSYQGDGVVAYFGWPQASENAAERAVRSALSVLKSAGEISVPDGSGLQVRAGIATGMVVVGDSAKSRALDQVAMGPTPNLAARIESQAAANEILISQQTWQIAGHAFNCESRGAHVLKGFNEPQMLYAVNGVRDVVSRFAAKALDAPRYLIGRDKELKALEQQWQAASQHGMRWVLVRAAAGLGKSSLLDQLIRHTQAQNAHHLVWQCSPLQLGQDFWPVVRQWFLSAGVDRQHSPSRQLTTLTRFAEQRVLDRPDELVSAIGELSGLLAANHSDPIAWRRDVMDLLANYIVKQIEQQPLLLVVEDAHWIDPSTIDLLKRLAELLPDQAKFCVVIAMRPEEGTVPPLAFDLELELSPLSLKESIDVVQQHSPILLSEDIAEAISKRAEGVPLFLEEFTRSVVSDPKLLQATVSEIRFDVDKVDIPASLNDALMARLDRQPGLQLIAQRASVLGREFSEVILARLVNMEPEDLRAQLEGLVQADVLKPIEYESTERRYQFSHALVRDVAYRSLLSGKRRELHRMVAEFSGTIDVLKDRHVWRAGHFSAAGEPERAIPLYLDAISALQRRHAFGEVAVVAGDALKLLDSVDDKTRRDEFGVLLYTAQAGSFALTIRLSHPDTRDAYQNALYHARELDNVELIFDAQFGFWQHLRSVPRFALAAEVADELIDQAGTLGEFRQARSFHSLGSCQLWLGQPSDALKSLSQSHSLHSREGRSRHELNTAIDESVSIWHLEAMCHWMAGEYSQAVDLIHNMSGALLPDSTPLDRVWAAVCRCMLFSLNGDVEACGQAVVDCDNVLEQADLPQWSKLARYFTVWYVARTDSSETALQMIEGVEHSAVCKPYYLTNAADVCLRHSRASQAREYIEIGLEGIADSQELWWEPELYRMRGIISKAQNDSASNIGQDFSRALSIATERDAHALALRAATSYAELKADNGEITKAVDLLEPHFQKVAQGGNCADLDHAQRLLGNWSCQRLLNIEGAKSPG